MEQADRPLRAFGDCLVGRWKRSVPTYDPGPRLPTAAGPGSPPQCPPACNMTFFSSNATDEKRLHFLIENVMELLYIRRRDSCPTSCSSESNLWEITSAGAVRKVTRLESTTLIRLVSTYLRVTLPTRTFRGEGSPGVFPFKLRQT